MKSCVTCELRFEPKYPKQLFCSQPCALIFKGSNKNVRRKMLSKVSTDRIHRFYHQIKQFKNKCECCGNQFLARQRRERFCSQDCKFMKERGLSREGPSVEKIRISGTSWMKDKLG